MTMKKIDPFYVRYSRRLAEKLKKMKPVPRKVKFKRDTVMLAALSHASFAVFFLIGPFTMAVPMVIWILERRRPKPVLQVEFHARQAFFYQLAVYLAAAALIGLAALLVAVFIGLAMVPFVILAFLAAVVYAVYGGLQVWNGRRFKYKFVTNFIERFKRKP
jgi:uncharacterized Tic20 family protein